MNEIFRFINREIHSCLFPSVPNHADERRNERRKTPSKVHDGSMAVVAEEVAATVAAAREDLEVPMASMGLASMARAEMESPTRQKMTEAIRT